MSKVVAINGSPATDKGETAQVLNPFIKGMQEAGAEVELFYASRLKIKPCACNEMTCWYTTPGECCIRDDMQMLYAHLKAADTLIVATPVYIPLPGAMQNLINRLCPLAEPRLEWRDGRTRARRRAGVSLERIALVSTGGWWESENMDIVIRIVEEVAAKVGVEFAGAVRRPHAFLMRQAGQLTGEGEAVLAAARRAGYELVSDGAMAVETLQAISRPLISEEELRQRYNALL